VETILELAEGLVIDIWSNILNKSLKPGFPHMLYNDAMERVISAN
jgi:aspartyl-tRNA synthetase